MRYIEIYRDIKRKITEGVYQPLSRIPFVEGLMDEYSAGRCTVQHALRLLEKEGVTKGVRSKGTYVCGNTGVNLFESQAIVKKILFLVPGPVVKDLCIPYISKIAAGAEDEALGRGVEFQVQSLRGKSAVELAGMVSHFSANGVIMLSITKPSIVRELASLPVKKIAVDMIEPDGRMVCMVGNNAMGGEKAVSKLAELGHKRILMVIPSHKSNWMMTKMNRLKWEGARSKAASIPGLDLATEWISIDDSIDERIRLIFEHYKNSTGIIFIGKPIFDSARRIIGKACSNRRLKEMDYVVFECYDDNPQIGTTRAYVCQWDGVAMGKAAVSRLLESEMNKRQRIVYWPMEIN